MGKMLTLIAIGFLTALSSGSPENPQGMSHLAECEVRVRSRILFDSKAYTQIQRKLVTSYDARIGEKDSEAEFAMKIRDIELLRSLLDRLVLGEFVSRSPDGTFHIALPFDLYPGAGEVYIASLVRNGVVLDEWVAWNDARLPSPPLDRAVLEGNVVPQFSGGIVLDEADLIGSGELTFRLSRISSGYVPPRGEVLLVAEAQRQMVLSLGRTPLFEFPFLVVDERVVDRPAE